MGTIDVHLQHCKFSGGGISSRLAGEGGWPNNRKGDFNGSEENTAEETVLSDAQSGRTKVDGARFGDRGTLHNLWTRERTTAGILRFCDHGGPERLGPSGRYSAQTQGRYAPHAP